MTKRDELKYFPAFIVKTMDKTLGDNAKWLIEIYLKYLSLIDYALVGFTGFIINTIILYTLTPIFPLWIANAIAVMIAFLSNWIFSVGPLGYIMGLKEKKNPDA